MKLRKCLFAILKLWKHENICLQYMNNENMNIFAYITWIMKIFVGITSIWNTWIMKIGKYLFAINELWKNENVCLQNMNYEHLCLHYMNYENILFKIHELWKK